MPWAALSTEPWSTAPRLAPETAKATFLSEATASGLLWVDLSPPRPAVRGRLGLFIEGAIERALEARGAPPPSGAASFDRTAALSDQIDRASVSGTSGIALWVGSLENIANATSTLDSDDSGVLRWWLEAVVRYPVRLAFDAANQTLGVQLEPVTLGSLLARAADQGTMEPREDERPMSVVEATIPLVVEVEESASPSSRESDDLEPESGPQTMAESARAMASELSNDDDTVWLRDALMELSTPPPPARPSIAAVEVTATSDDETDLELEDHFPPPPAAPRLELRFADASVEPPPPAFELDSDARRRLEACARELDAANGPKPLTVVERLFSTAYMPLRAALDRGAEIPAARRTADEWAASFEKSYTDGFDALRVRTKRPPMVVDVPDIALRVARLHGARTTQLLLVDAMRFDIGEGVNEKLRALVGQRAACAERFLLWSALPTTTTAQVELIGRGPAGLRDAGNEVTEELMVARGRKSQMIRRLKTGHRELLKLDVVAARLGEPGGADPARFGELESEVAARLAAHFEGLQPRTLVMVFGDHGFSISDDDGRPTAHEGGASPEEVLVPAFAWLVGAVH